MTKHFKIVGNWKMNKTIQEAKDFVQGLPPLLAPHFLAVPFTCLKTLSDLEIPMLKIGAQNTHFQPKGAFTGEISPPMLSEAGAQFVILGHSERRQQFNESSTFINKKVKACLLQEMPFILCIGESAIDRDHGKTEEVLQSQIIESLSGIDETSLAYCTIAYEPIWAIGTGIPATAQTAQEVHFKIKHILSEKWGQKAASMTSILYGGSVTPETIQELSIQPNIDGALIGGASLNIETFSKIIALVGGQQK